MAVYGAYVSSTLGMMSQSHSLNTISSNLANINTGAYKANETRFSTVLSESLFEQSDLGGIRVKDYQRIDKQGSLIGSDRDMDVAINGKGFFILNTEVTGKGRTYYGRDGSFDIATPGLTGTTIADDGNILTIKQGFLADKNGFFVQGREPSADGTFPSTGDLTSLRVDQFALAASGKATSNAALDLNLPALDSPGDPQVDRVTIGGTVEANDTYSVTVNGTTVTYAVTGVEANIGVVRDALVSAINANATLNALITAAADGSDCFTLTAKQPGTAFTSSAAFTNRTPVAQSDTVTIGGTFEVGDVYTATVNGAVYSYTSSGPGDVSNANAATGLAALINANPAVTASAAGNVFTITAAVAGTPYTLSSVGATGGGDVTQTATAAVVTANAGSTGDNTAVSANIQPNRVATNPRVYNANVFDSNGKARTADLNFEKSTTNNQWNMTITTERDPVAQVDTATLTGLVEATDTFSITVNGTTITYTVTGAEADINVIRDALVTKINDNTTLEGATVSRVATAAAGTGAGELTLTAKTAGTAFTSSAASTNRTAIAQSDTITIGGTFELGDVYTATVNEVAHSYTSAGGDVSNANAATGLAALINADPAVTASTAGGVITITAAAAGTPFTLSAVGATGGGDTTQTATAAVGTANVTADLNTVTKATTTANVTPTVTSAPVPLIFSPKGLLISPTTAVAITATFPGTTSPATINLDVSGFTQYAGEFITVNYTQNGFVASDIRSLTFNPDGEIVASFGKTGSRSIYKVPLAVFSNPNTLERKNGNVFAQTPDSGKPKIINAESNGFAEFVSNALELSNVGLADQFAKMIITQGAYNSSATVFKTVDELLMTARDLKQ